MKLAPVVLFVYNRPWHTEETLEALMKNELADHSRLYIYSDGPKNNSAEDEINKIKEVRAVILKKKWCKEVIIIERKQNLGLANSIIDGVSEVVEKHGKVIVLEDDIVTSSGFLNFMNASLNTYEEEEKVMHISGFMYPHNDKLPETFFYNVPLCWGWATWKRAWKLFSCDSIFLWNEIYKKDLFLSFDRFGGDYLSSQLAHNVTGKLKTWFIKWHASVLLKGGFTLFPSISLVDNIGFDNTGVNNGTTSLFKNEVLATNISVENIELIENPKAAVIIQDFYAQIIQPKSLIKPKKSGFKLLLKRKSQEFFYKFFPELKGTTMAKAPDLVNFKSYTGNHCKIYPNVRLNNSLIGNYTYVAENSRINNTTIGKFCSIGPNLISGWGIHPTVGISTHPMFYSTIEQNGMTLSKENKIEEILPIKIGNDVFIGMNVLILDGVTIGDGAIIGAGAVVSKDIPPYAIAIGCPIKIRSYRFDEEIIEKLLKIKWWDLEERNLTLVEKNFFEVETFIEKIINNTNKEKLK